VVKKLIFFKGVYVATNFNASNLQNLNYIPKKLPYGMYKIHLFITDKKNQRISCFVTIIQIKQLSETYY